LVRPGVEGIQNANMHLFTVLFHTNQFNEVNE